MDNNDFNIDNYTTQELLLILGLDDLNPNAILERTNEYIRKLTDDNQPTMADFFLEVQMKLLDEAQKEKVSMEDKNEEKKLAQQNDWWNNEVLNQPNNPVQNDKITERKQKVQVFDNQQFPMNREQLGINDTFSVPVEQDVLNPNLQNVITRFICLDSQFRQASGGTEGSSSNYIVDLSEPITNALSIYLYSVQIPYSWYTIDTAYGNTCFWLIFNNDTTINVTINIPPGNYSSDQLVEMLNMGSDGSSNFNQTSIVDPKNYFTFPQAVSASYPIKYNTNTGKITMNLYGGSYTQNGVTYNIDTTTCILFYDSTAQFSCGSSKCNATNVINQTLGWIMGYRLPYVYVDASGNTASTLLELYGPKYLVIALDDYNQNRINNGLITIAETSKNMKLPTYYNSSIPYVCTSAPSVTPLTSTGGNIYTPSQGLLFAEKSDINYKQIPQVLPSAPRILTNAQIYTINEIIKNNEKNTNYRSKAPTTSDTFALLPIKHGDSSGGMVVEFSGALKDNKRIYFGPVDIERLHVQLYDDKGNILNLNGSDWSMTIIVDILYQY
jgi:hypothetical protein